MNEIPDPMERGESSAERWADDNYTLDSFRCAACEKWFPWAGGNATASADPFSPAICLACAETQEPT